MSKTLKFLIGGAIHIITTVFLMLNTITTSLYQNLKRIDNWYCKRFVMPPTPQVKSIYRPREVIVETSIPTKSRDIQWFDVSPDCYSSQPSDDPNFGKLLPFPKTDTLETDSATQVPEEIAQTSGPVRPFPRPWKDSSPTNRVINKGGA